MQIGFNEATTMKRSDLSTDLRLTDQVGFEGIEIRIDQLQRYLESHRVEDLKHDFASRRIRPWTFNALESATFRGAEGHRQLLADCRSVCEVGQVIGCDTIIVVPSNDVGDRTLAEIQRETARVLRELGAIAENYGMRLAFEFIGYPNCSVNTFAQAYDIVQAVDAANIGLTVDCFHFHAMNSRLQDLQMADARHIFMVHLDDCEPYPPGYLRDHHRLFPGLGVIDLAGILTTLQAIGYDGPCSVETFRPEYWDADVKETIQRAKDTAEALMARVLGGADGGKR
ncbi:MAG: isomerase [Sulfobacillus acidophilus]|uniref:Isomerase n=1 Tax=Sulfobacillus acidophilus TaxID=53633 RepID=A0A2T2WJH3_9FIRM|nr:MAG: isomerase [Sulfobacillus acidophilus]